MDDPCPRAVWLDNVVTDIMIALHQVRRNVDEGGIHGQCSSHVPRIMDYGSLPSLHKLLRTKDRGTSSLLLFMI